MMQTRKERFQPLFLFCFDPHGVARLRSTRGKRGKMKQTECASKGAKQVGIAVAVFPEVFYSLEDRDNFAVAPPSG